MTSRFIVSIRVPPRHSFSAMRLCFYTHGAQRGAGPSPPAPFPRPVSFHPSRSSPVSFAALSPRFFCSRSPHPFDFSLYALLLLPAIRLYPPSTLPLHLLCSVVASAFPSLSTPSAGLSFSPFLHRFLRRVEEAAGVGGPSLARLCRFPERGPRFCWHTHAHVPADGGRRGRETRARVGWKKEYVTNVQETAHTRSKSTVGGRIEERTGGRVRLGDRNPAPLSRPGLSVRLLSL